MQTRFCWVLNPSVPTVNLFTIMYVSLTSSFISLLQKAIALMNILSNTIQAGDFYLPEEDAYAAEQLLTVENCDVLLVLHDAFTHLDVAKKYSVPSFGCMH